MYIGACVLTFRAAYVNSLKEKRMILKSIIEKTRHKFNVSIAEVDTQEEHKILTIGFACVSNDKRHIDSMLEHIIHFMEMHTEAELIAVEKELL